MSESKSLASTSAHWSADDQGRSKPAPAWPHIAGYDIVCELGRGGMGVVYMARHVQLKREVAIKMIRAGAHAAAGERARFKTEAEAAARLQHPNIVQIYEIADQDGCPYLALEYVRGPSLAEILRQCPLPARRAAELVASIARAVHYAHQHGIVHRDLKPANILLDVSDGQPPHGCPKIADFGLAKVLDAEVHHTHTGVVMGSPSYMAPEQAAGQTRDIGPATDVYALGAILYEMLTGRPPFVAATPIETLDQVRSQEPVSPVRLNKNLPRDLETICLKCLEKDPTRRYATAEEVSDDLDRHLSGELILARSFGVAHTLARSLTSTPGAFKLRTWSNLLLLCSPLPFLSNLVVFILILEESEYVPASIAAMLIASPASAAIIFLKTRWYAIAPMNPLERQFWSIWFAVPASLTILFFVYHKPATPEEPLADLAIFPAIAVVHGFAFWVMGSTFWGGTYIAGIAFFLIALVMPLHLPWAPLEFGLLMSATIAAIARHTRRGPTEELASVKTMGS